LPTTNIIANLFVDVHPSKGDQTLFHDGNFFLIASTVGNYALQQMLLRVLADGSTSLLCNALYDIHSSRLEIAVHRL